MLLKKYLKEVLLCTNIILLLGLYVLFLLNNKNFNKDIDNSIILQNEEAINNNVVENTTEESENYYVEVKGAVKNPGVYHVLLKNTINDVIEMSGGFLETAYTNNINLSKKVKDEMVIYVYTKKEYKNLNKTEIKYVYKSCTCPTYDISSCTENSESTIETDENVQENAENNVININTASKEELMTLSGIGEAKANNIISYRQSNGDFKEIHDLVNVSGISETIYEKIKDNITV